MADNMKLELTWIDKDKNINVEPRVLIESVALSYSKKNESLLETSEFDNILIHGDNLLALKALENKYNGKVKCIYIDPPYNTRSAFTNYDDGLEHSIWLQLMRSRLVILHKLLKDDGIMFVSIDDNEEAYLRVLLDEIFGRNNFVANCPTIMNLKGNQDQFAFAGTHEYTLVYAKDRTRAKFKKFNVEDEELEEWEKDEIGLYKKGANLKSTGINAPREKRPNLFYPIYVSDESKISLFKDNNFYHEVLPITNGQEMSWRWSKSKIEEEKHNVIVVKNGSEYSFYKKQRPEIGEAPSKKPKSLLYKPEYSSGNGTSQIKKLFGYKAFDYPKPEELIRDLLHIASNEGDIVLDSFLGSGTTIAVAHKMNRRWIGIELGEHAYTLCKTRIDSVINGEQGGISKNVNWQGGGGYKFYELAPTLIKTDAFGQEIINPEYNAEMLSSAVAIHEGYKYNPDSSCYWKQASNEGNSYLFVTTNHVNRQIIDAILTEMKEDEYLVIVCKSFDANATSGVKNITIKKIPQLLLNNCEFGVDNYNLNIICPPTYEEDEEDE